MHSVRNNDSALPPSAKVPNQPKFFSASAETDIPMGEPDEDGKSNGGNRPTRIDSEDLNVRLLKPLIQYVKEKYGEDNAERVAETAGLKPTDFEGSKYWISLSQFETVLAEARSLMRNDEEFRQACSYRMTEGYGLLRFLVRATSVASVLSHAETTMQHVSRISRYKILSIERNRIHYIYTTRYPESRLICISRQAQVEAFPTLWGLPPAHVEELKCVANGDDVCEYIARWYELPRWLTVMIGAGAGGALALLLLLLGVSALSPVPWLIILGGAAGYVYEMWRTNRVNLAFGEEVNRDLRDLARKNAEAMQEILAFHARQRDWSRLLEEQATERAAAFQKILDGVQSLTRERDTTIRSMSHDLKNPLTFLKMAASIIVPHIDPSDQEAMSTIREMEENVDRMDRMVKDLMVTIIGRTNLVSVTAARLDMQPMVDTIRRRLRALVFGRDIRTSVFSTREAPAEIETDLLVFDRVIDNLLTNAAKYTEQGSIVVEFSGTPGMLAIKVSDTGPGISEDRINRVFEMAETGQIRPDDKGFGIGLSVVVRLLDQIGGCLDVMSRPGLGTTFWAHFPEHLAPTSVMKPPVAPESLHSIMNRVLKIRKVQNA